jgi:hypothetical protein
MDKTTHPLCHEPALRVNNSDPLERPCPRRPFEQVPNAKSYEGME